MLKFVSNFIEDDTVTVRVPASSANLGSGFDCTGIAFSKYNVLSFTKLENAVEFEGFEPQFSCEKNLAYVAYKRVCDKIGTPAYVKIKSVRNDIPISRGLGSSAALIVAGAYAANAINDKKLSLQEGFEICNEIEGHPDKISPALFGGLCTSIVADDNLFTQKYSVSDKIFFTALVPDFKVSTKDARAALPDMVSRADAIFNLQRIALLPYAMENGSLVLIKAVTGDRLHEAYRRPLYKNVDEVEAAAYSLGAISFNVSGAGPTCLCYSDKPIADELNERLKEMDNGWVAYALTVDNEGAKRIYDEQ